MTDHVYCRKWTNKYTAILKIERKQGLLKPKEISKIVIDITTWVSIWIHSKISSKRQKIMDITYYPYARQTWPAFYKVFHLQGNQVRDIMKIILMFIKIYGYQIIKLGVPGIIFIAFVFMWQFSCFVHFHRMILSALQFKVPEYFYP